MNEIIIGDCRDTMRKLIADGVKVQMCVTSPPYWGLRDYGVAGQLGLESTPQDYVANMVEVFGLVRELLADDGTLWLNLGDSYAGAGYSNHDNTGGAARTDGGKQRHTTLSGLKPKDLVGIPWRVAFALQADGWYLRSDIIWSKPNPMPESVTDRPTKAHEYLFLMAKSERYYYDADAISEPAMPEHAGRYKYDFSGSKEGQAAAMPEGYTIHPEGQRDYSGKRNRRTVWTIATQSYSEAHFATFPPKLIEPCILAGSRVGDIVFDPFMGSGTTAQVAQKLGRQYLGCELNEAYAKMQDQRTAQKAMELI